MTVSLRHPRTGEVKALPEGWSWGCFLGCSFLGLPLFRRGLQTWGMVMVAFDIVALVVELVPTEPAAEIDLWLLVITTGLCVFFGLKANEMTIERHLSLGWEPAGASSLTSRRA